VTLLLGLRKDQFGCTIVHPLFVSRGLNRQRKTLKKLYKNPL